MTAIRPKAAYLLPAPDGADGDGAAVELLLQSAEWHTMAAQSGDRVRHHVPFPLWADTQ